MHLLADGITIFTNPHSYVIVRFFLFSFVYFLQHHVYWTHSLCIFIVIFGLVLYSTCCTPISTKHTSSYFSFFLLCALAHVIILHLLRLCLLSLGPLLYLFCAPPLTTHVPSYFCFPLSSFLIKLFLFIYLFIFILFYFCFIIYLFSFFLILFYFILFLVLENQIFENY